MSGARVLIVENETIVARDIQLRLRQIGYQADWVAQSGEEAVKFTRESPPQIVLMDIRLGDGIDGVETVEKIHSICDIPILFLTAFSDEASIARAKGAEPFGYIIKPVETIELRIAIEIAIHRHHLQCKLNESNRRLSTTLASIGDGVIATDSFGVVQVANRVAAFMIGRDAENLVGERIDRVFLIRSQPGAGLDGTPEDPVTELFTMKSEMLTYSDVLLSHRWGLETSIDLTATLIRDDRNEPDGAVVVFRDISRRKQAEEELRYRAYYDDLTGLLNRSSFYERMKAAIAVATRHSRNLALLFLDLDDFKTVNDSLGHDAGDMLLKQLAGRLKASVRDDDTVARLAGDEFVIILSDIANVSDVEDIATKILRELDRSFSLGEEEVTVSASIGISLSPLHGSEIDKLIRYADTAMYLAKQKGKNAYAIYAADWKSELPEG